jgi:hypothetical protein
MTTLHSFSSGATISSSQVNANFTDFASEVTGSLPRNGEAAMTGQMKAASGTVSAPGITFGADLDCGLYRIGADNVGFAAGGALIFDYDGSGIDIASGKSLTKNSVAVECFAGSAATKWPFYMDSAPTGWTIVTSSMNDRALRVVSGSGAGGGTGGATGGTTAFTSVLAARTISASNIPDLTITITDPGHDHVITGNTTAAAGGAVGVVSSGGTGITGSRTTGITAAFGTTARGGAQSTIDFAVTYASVIICSKD